MLVDMTIANFKSVKTPQTISFEAVRDGRFDASKVVAVNEKLKLIRSAAIIGPNGAGKSTFIRALEALKFIVTAADDAENPLRILAGTAFQYDPQSKIEPSTITLRVVLEPGSGDDDTVIAIYTLKATFKKIYEESLFHVVGHSKKLMFERKMDGASLLAGDDEKVTYTYRWGKMYRGEKKRLVGKLDAQHSFLSASAHKGGETSSMLYHWIDFRLNILPMGVSQTSEKYIADMIEAHKEWVEQLKNFLWALDITDIRDVRVQNGRVVFIHTNVTQHYASYFSSESLSLRRLCLMGIAFFESFTAGRTLVIDDFGMLLHPYVLAHVVEIFESCNRGFGSQMLVVDCNPSLLKKGLLRRDGIYFASKDSESATVYFSLANYKYSRSNDKTQAQYMAGAFGALPLLSEFSFADASDKEV